MIGTNGASKSPAKSATRSIVALAHDVVTLAELQAQLVKTELRDWAGGLVRPAIVLIVACGVALSCVPVLLMCLAYALVEFAGWSPTLALLVATLVGLGVAGAAAAFGVRQLKQNTNPLTRSQEEFRRNMHWIKQVLKHKANPEGGDCEQASSAHSKQPKSAESVESYWTPMSSATKTKNPRRQE